MSVLDPGKAAFASAYASRLKWCFKCGAPFDGMEPVVMWVGTGSADNSSSNVGLHAGCAASLGMHLIRDAFAADPTVLGKIPR